MVLLSAVTPPLSTPNCSTSSNLLFYPNTAAALPLSTLTPHRTSPLSLLTTNASSLADPNLLRHVCVDESEDSERGGEVTVSSASAVARAIRMASTSPVEFLQRIDEVGKEENKVMPSADFQKLCVEQLDLFRRVVHPGALLSVSSLFT